MSTRWTRWLGLGVPALLLDTAGHKRANGQGDDEQRTALLAALEAESDEEE